MVFLWFLYWYSAICGWFGSPRVRNKLKNDPEAWSHHPTEQYAHQLQVSNSPHGHCQAKAKLSRCAVVLGRPAGLMSGTVGRPKQSLTAINRGVGWWLDDHKPWIPLNPIFPPWHRNLFRGEPPDEIHLKGQKNILVCTNNMQNKVTQISPSNNLIRHRKTTKFSRSMWFSGLFHPFSFGVVDHVFPKIHGMPWPSPRFPSQRGPRPPGLTPRCSTWWTSAVGWGRKKPSQCRRANGDELPDFF